MDTIFFATSFVFIVFLIVSYFLNVIRLSVPLLIIYFIYCFDYIVNTDQDLNNNQPITNYDYKDSDQLLSLQTGKIPSKDIKNINENQINPIPKPIVSYTPKPIKIDSNIIIQKGLDKKNDKNILKNTEVVEENLIKKESTLELNEIMICRGIYKRNPIKPGYEFINSVDSLFCYTKISNSGPKQEIKHVWFFEDKEISSVVYNIKTSYNYRSWSKKTIYPKQTGNWKVDVVDGKGNVLGTRDFSIKSISNTY